MMALFLLARAAESGERTCPAVVLVRQSAGDGELAALAMVVAATAAGARGFGPLGRGGMAAGTTGRAPLLLLVDRWSSDVGLGCGLGGSASFFFGAQARFLGSLLLGLAILVSAAALIFTLRTPDAFLATAGLFAGRKPSFLGFAEKLRLKLLTAGDVVLR
jgi:hypothetical protein